MQGHRSLHQGLLAEVMDNLNAKKEKRFRISHIYFVMKTKNIHISYKSRTFTQQRTSFTNFDTDEDEEAADSHNPLQVLLENRLHVLLTDVCTSCQEQLRSALDLIRIYM